MKRLLAGLVLVLSLAGCALTQARPDPGGAKLTIDQAAGYQLVVFDPGSLPAVGVTLTVTGVQLRYNTPTCSPVSAVSVVCKVGDRPPEGVYKLPVRGVSVAEADYARPDGTAYHLETD